MLLSRVALFMLLACCSVAAAAPSVCVSQKVVTNGELCRITPSSTYPGMIDQSGSNQGFGDYVVALPTTPNNKLWINFGGAAAKPYLPSTGRYFNEPWLTELMGQGYTVLDMAYDNEASVSQDCFANKDIDNCAGLARQEVIFGDPVSTLRNTNKVNSVQHRLKTLIDYLKANNFPLPKNAYPFKGWRNIGISGHSQGSGVAYYLSKLYGTSIFGCFLGGPFDVPDEVPTIRPPAEYIADWYLLPANKTGINKMGAFVTVDDDSYNQFTFTYNLAGLVKDTHWFEVDKVVYYNALGQVIDGHAAAVQDPSLASYRAQACFR